MQQANKYEIGKWNDQQNINIEKKKYEKNLIDIEEDSAFIKK